MRACIIILLYATLRGELAHHIDMLSDVLFFLFAFTR